MIVQKPVHVCDKCGTVIDVSDDTVDIELCISCGMKLIKQSLADGDCLWVENVCVINR